MQHHSRTIPVDGENYQEKIFLMVNILNRHEIPHRVESHNERNLCTARRPYDALTAATQRINLRTTRRPYDVLTVVAQ